MTDVYKSRDNEMPNLLIKKPFLQKINPKSLGYVCPNGQINFQTEEAALSYTKNTILKALKSGKEREVITKDASVLKIFDGNETSVTTNFSDFPDIAGCIQHHGHPSMHGYYAYPFSKADVMAFQMLNKVLGYKKAIVYNSLGEECTMTSNKKPLLSRLKLSPDIRRNLYYFNPKRFLNFIFLRKFEKNFSKKHNRDYYLKTFLKRCSKEEINLLNSIKEDKEKVRNWLTDKINALWYHDELKEYTPKLNITYRTNFNYLKTDLK